MAIDLVESSKIDYLVGDLIKNKEREKLNLNPGVRLHKIKDSNLKNHSYPDS